jgi:hypothetical protein
MRPSSETVCRYLSQLLKERATFMMIPFPWAFEA